MSFNLPYFPFYPADFLSDMKVVLMTNEQIGCYIKLLCYQWREGFIPTDDDKIATLLKVDCQKLARLKPGLLECFPRGVNSRLEIEREKAIRRHNQLSMSGKSGSNKRFPNKLRRIARLKPGLSISESESESESDIKKEYEKEKKKNDLFIPLIPKKETPKELKLVGVKIYFAEINCPSEEAEKFFDYYESKGWVVGKVPMKSWKAAARNWKRSWLEKNPHLKLKAKTKPPPPIPWVDIPMTPEEAKELQEAKKKLSFNLQRIGKKIPSEKLQQHPEVLKTLEEERHKK